jgi:hypothetical protein
MFRILLSFFALICSASLTAAELNSADIMNIAGRQRMLTQRIIKTYIQLGIKVQSEQAQHILDDSLEQFTRQHEQLKNSPLRSDQKLALAEVEMFWPGFRAIAGTPPNRDAAITLQDKGVELLRLSQQLANLLEARSDNPVDRIVNLAGRQRMLTQQLAKTYMLRAWNINSPALSREMETAHDEFASALTLLSKSPLNTPEIKRELESLTNQWEWFQTALEMEGAFSYRILVADTSETILTGLEKLVALYARQGRK